MAIRNLLIKLDAQEVMQLMLTQRNFDISTHLKSSIGRGGSRPR